MSLGTAIKALRNQRGWSQEELAFRIDTTAATISRIETGKHGAVDSLKSLLARTFGLRLSELMAMSETDAPSLPPPEKIGLKPDEAELLTVFRRLRGERRTILLDLARSLVQGAPPQRPRRKKA